jgi:hypothetical protein
MRPSHICEPAIWRKRPVAKPALHGRVAVIALIQLSNPVYLTDTLEKKTRMGLPSPVPRCSVEISRGPAFL